MEINQTWFEMLDLKKRKLDTSVWIPLRSEKPIRNKIKFGFVGYQEEFIGSGSLMVLKTEKSSTKEMQWTDIGIRPIQNSSFRNGEYIPSDIYLKHGAKATNLVLNQGFDNDTDLNEWHLHQDLVISLGLKREGDVWVCPQEGYIDVAKLERNHEGKPISLIIRNQFLKDYLCARTCGLYVSSYYSRDIIAADTSVLSWNEESKIYNQGKNSWECRIMPIHEGNGFPFGQQLSVSHAGRKDIFENEDVPDISQFPNDDNIDADFYQKAFKGKKVYRIMAELWKYDWIRPAQRSSIVLGQEDRTKVYFIIDAEGKKKSGHSLERAGRWLWFKPELVNTLLSKRGGFLSWHTRETGGVGCGPGGGVHFGVNDIGLITVYAKDIGRLPTWQQQVWAAFNVAPDGGISRELHSSQVKAVVAKTLAPENFIGRVIKDINNAATKQFNIKVFRGHHSVKEIVSTIHRFRATDDKGLYSLAKDIARVIVDDIDMEAVQKIAIPPKGTKWGSLKTLENLLATRIPSENARKILSPLVGVYELRHGDAHLPSSDIVNSFKLVGINRHAPYILQGYQMIYACVDNLHVILRII